MEVVTGIVVIDTVVPTLVATVIATALTRVFVGAGPIYGQRVFVMTSPGELAAFALVALIASIVAFGFTKLVAACETAFRRPWLRAPLATCGRWPRRWRNHRCAARCRRERLRTLNDILGGAAAVDLVAVLLIAKCLATASSVGSGAPGGVFTPTLLIGGCTGYLVGEALTAFRLDVGPPGGYALVGMAAAIAAATHAPMMAAVLAFELSGDYAVVLPLVLATALVTALARTLGRDTPEGDSIYTAELRTRGISWELTMEGREVDRSPHDASGAGP